MYTTHRALVVKCPGCGARIDVSIGRFPGGNNDRGGFVMECNQCQKRAYLPVPNPDDASSITGGAKVIATWDDEIGNRATVLAANGLTAQDEASESLLIVESNEKESPLFDMADRAIYICQRCHQDLEQLGYQALRQVIQEVNTEIGSFIGRLWKGYETAPRGIELALYVKCDCAEHRLVFFQPFSEGKSALTSDVMDYSLAGPNDPDLLTEIDGIYSRDDCLGVLKKLLVRWQARNRVVLLVTPFIGLDYPGREENRMKLWNLVLRYTDPSRTLLVTRKATFNGFLKAAKSTGLDIETLKKFQILSPLLNNLSSKDAIFKQQSHAKFYAAVGPKNTEVLYGSFNLHSGEYVENLSFRVYDTARFFTRYLFPLGVILSPLDIATKRSALNIDVRENKVVSSSFTELF